jgi:hypothetical protein
METKYTYGSVSSSDGRMTRRNGSNGDDDATEWMIAPSNNSTSNPSLENLSAAPSNGTNTNTNNTMVQPPPPASHETYQLLRAPIAGTTDDDDEIQMQYLRHGNTLKEAWYQHVSGSHVRTRTVTWLAVITAVLIGVVGWFYIFHRGYDWTPHQPSPNTWRDSDLVPYGPSTKKNGSRAPFSKLHPVKDMGLYDFPRPKTNRPARPIKEGLPDRNNYPTNAWYQSLLMPAGEPDETHRAYAIPYVVDTVGPMPGLRLHPNHIDASTFVVQLYVINEYGLTVGAARNAALTSQHLSTTNESAAIPTHQYHVTHATPLGVTLDWVRTEVLECGYVFFVFFTSFVLKKYMFPIFCCCSRTTSPCILLLRKVCPMLP